MSPHSHSGMDVPARPDEKPFPGPLPGLGKCHQPFVKLSPLSSFLRGTGPPKLGPPARLCLPAAAEGDTHGMMLGQSHHHQRVRGGAPQGSLTAAVARCQCPLRARCWRVAAAHQLAGRCSRWVVQPRWPAPGLSPPRPRHHPLVFSASQLAPLVAAAAASALAARTSWL